MKRIGWYAAVGFLSLLLTGCDTKASPIIEMLFGTTDWVWNHDLPASDYIPNFHRKLPDAAKICNVELLGLNNNITDGGEAAYFSSSDVEAAQKCLKREIPQGEFGTIERSEWNKLVKEHPGFPTPLGMIPEQVALPPPQSGSE